MRQLLFSTALACALTATLSAAAAPRAAANAGRAFTVADSIGFSDFIYPGIQYGTATSRLVPSPDGTQVLAVTVRGDLASGRRIASLWALDVAAGEAAAKAGRPLAPRLLGTSGSASNVDPVSNWRWSADGRSVLFLAADDEGVRRLVRLAVADGRETTLSAPDQDVSSFAEAAGRTAYLAHAPLRPADLKLAGGPRLPDVVDGYGQNLLPLLFPNAMTAMFGDFDDILWTVADGAPAAVQDPATGRPLALKNAKLAMSPDGRRLVVTRYAAHVPAAWERYAQFDDNPAFRITADKPGQTIVDSVYRPQSYVAIDLASGQAKPVVDTPIEIDRQFEDAGAAVSPNGRRVAVLGAFPTGPGPGSDRDVLPCVLGVAEGGVLSCLEPGLRPSGPHVRRGLRPQVTALAWEDADTLVVRRAAPEHADQVVEARYRHGAEGWAKLGEAPYVTPATRFAVREAFDTPPALVLRGQRGDDAMLWDPNPQLRGVALGQVTAYSWKDPDGDVWSGALVRPPHYDAKRRYPLIVQTHGLDRSRFLVDGPSPTGYAAQAFAAKDILVLQVDELPKGGQTPAESRIGARAYRAAAEQLAREGHVDLAKVGAIGWSHYGPYVMQGMVDRPSDYAAVTFADSAYNFYDEYLVNIDYMGSSRELLFRQQVGPKPFGAGLKTWVDQSAGFQTDRVCTPILWQVNDALSFLYGWGSYAALRAQGKPIDLLYFRNGSHVLVQPRERLVEQGQNVDWYDYWLNGHKDPDPAKAAQYARWDLFRAGPRCGDAGSTPPAPRF